MPAMIRYLDYWATTALYSLGEGEYSRLLRNVFRTDMMQNTSSMYTACFSVLKAIVCCDLKCVGDNIRIMGKFSFSRYNGRYKSLVVRASDSRPEGMEFDTRCHQTPSEYTRSTCSLNQWVRSLVGLITSAGTGEYFPPLQFTCRNCGGGDRGCAAIYRSFGEFRRAKSYCHLYGAQGQRQAYLLPMPR
ncbi:hypothetical protein TNCV_763431 [Trichonephila clavipes]|nr:hypothetical protein TNCV_763431 [Trichonephila clavipes]